MTIKTNECKLVSIIIPAFNAELLISETIDTLLKQTYKNIELIVVDDGSTDKTRTVVESYGDKVTYIYQDNSGSCSSPRNTGFKHAKGDYILFFDADDLMLPDNIAKSVAYLSQYPDAGIVCSDYKNFRIVNGVMEFEVNHFSTCTLLGEKLILDGELYLSGKDAAIIMLQESFCCACSVMFRRMTFEDVGGFDETLSASEDFDINYRVMLNFNCGIINSIGFYRRLHGENLTTNTVVMCINGINSAKKLLTLESELSKRIYLQRRIIVRLFSLSIYYRNISMCRSLSYNLKALQYINAFNQKLSVQFIRSITASLLAKFRNTQLASN